METSVAAIWADVLGVDPIGSRRRFPGDRRRFACCRANREPHLRRVPDRSRAARPARSAHDRADGGADRGATARAAWAVRTVSLPMTDPRRGRRVPIAAPCRGIPPLHRRRVARNPHRRPVRVTPRRRGVAVRRHLPSSRGRGARRRRVPGPVDSRHRARGPGRHRRSSSPACWASEWRQQFGAAVVVDNRPGANGIIGNEFAKRASPDGYTLLAASTATHVMTPHVVASLPYDPLQDFVPVINLVYQTKVVLVSSALGVATLGELVALARSRPGQLNYAIGRRRVVQPPRHRAARRADGDRARAHPVSGLRADRRGAQRERSAGPARQRDRRAAGDGHGSRPRARRDGRSAFAAAAGCAHDCEAGLPRLDVQTWIGFLAPAGTPPPDRRQT